jgi:uncharacterized membrane-anchored protein YhcB (DUF1043 family)
VAAESINPVRLRAPQYFIALRSTRVWGWRLALFAFSVYLFAAIAVDVLPRDPSEWLFLLGCEAAAFVVALVVGLIIRRFLIEAYRNHEPGSWLNAGLFVLVGMFKNAVGSLLIYSNEAFDFGRLARDLINGIVAGAFIGFLFILVFGAQLYQLQTIQNLQQNQTALETILANFEGELARHRQELKLSALQVLRPQFEQISKALGQASNRRNLIARLSNSIDEGVRPLIGQLNDMNFFISKTMHAAGNINAMKPQRLRPDYSSDMRPIAIWLAAAPGLVALLIFIQDADGVMRGLVASLCLLIASWCAKTLRGKIATKFHEHYISTSTLIAILVATAVSLAASGTDFDAKFLATFAVSSVGAFGLQLIFLYSGSIDRSTAQVAEQLRLVVARLETANHVLQRSMWVERKKWANMLHGRVQALLTGCVIQISSAKSISTKLRREIENAVAEGLRVIESGVSDSLDIEQALSSVVEAWAGVCEVDLKISKTAKQALARDSHLAFVVNSIAKEVVSKFYAELSSQSLSISIDIEAGGNLVLEADSSYKAASGTLRDFDFAKTEFLAKVVDVQTIRGQMRFQAKLERIAEPAPL